MPVGDSEAAFETDVLSWASDIGWDTHRATEFEKRHPRRTTQAFFPSLVETALVELNDCVSPTDAGVIVDRFGDRFRTQAELVEANQSVYGALSRGIDVEVPSVGEMRTVQVVDLDEAANNRFDAVQQFSFEQGHSLVRPDVVLLVNGIPFVVAELKASNRGKNVQAAITDLRNYESDTPTLFYSALFNVAATRQQFRYGAVGASETQYKPWKPEDTAPDALPGKTGYDAAASFRSLCRPERLLEVAREYVFFNESGPKSSKILPRHPQYFGANSIKTRYESASARGLPTRDGGGENVSGLVWHTQGSGKSYTMYYAARHVVRERRKMAVIIVDTLNLKEQFSRELRQLSPGFDVVVPESKRELRAVLSSNKNQIVLTNIHLFDGIEDPVCDEEVFLFSDEAHRFMENDLGSHIDAALPCRNHFGFTGTPVQEGANRDTFSHFAMDVFDTDDHPFLHRYSMLRGVQEGVIVPVNITDRRDAMEWELSKSEMDASLVSKYGVQNEEEINELVASELSAREVAKLPSRADVMATDISEYFERVQGSPGANKAMVVTSSREAAALLGERLQDAIGTESVRVLYTSQPDDPDHIAQFHTDKHERENIQSRYKYEDEPTVLVVCDMLLTGFDAPILHTIFLDRNLSGHTLMQAIARANRPLEGKPFGEIVDYWGVYDEIESMYDSMADEIELYISVDKDAFIDRFESQLARLQRLCDSPPGRIGETAVDAEALVSAGNAETFTDEFKSLRDLRRAIQPDGRMLSYDESYKRLQNVFYQISSIETPGGNIDRKQFVEDAREAIESSSTVNRNPVEPDDPFRVERWMSEDLQVHRIYHKVEDVLTTRSKQTPAYAELSERVEDIITKWNQDYISSTEALEEFEAVEGAFDDKPQPSELDDRDWFEQVVVDVLIEETPEDISVDEGVVETIVDAFDTHWETTRKMTPAVRRRKLTTEVRKSLLYYGTGGKLIAKELAKSDFSHKVCGYLIRNASSDA